MANAIRPVCVSAGLVTRSGQLLICQRRRDALHALKWEFPGGKVKDGEDEATCLRRELAEELGIQATLGEELHRTSHAYPNGRRVALTFFHIPTYQGALANNVFETLAWVEPTQLLDYDFLEGNIAFVTNLVQGRWGHIFSTD